MSISSNHTVDVSKDSTTYSERSLNRATAALVDYLRDCKAPLQKRSLAHLFQHFCHEREQDEGEAWVTYGSNHARFPRMLLCRAIEALMSENRLYCLRESGVVGTSSESRDYPLACNAKDWIVYNPFPHQTRKQEQKKNQAAAITHNRCGKSGTPCVDAQIYYQGQNGKWTRGKQRALTDFDLGVDF